MGDTPTAKGFGCLWANREGVCRSVLALQPPSGALSFWGVQALETNGGHSHQRGEGGRERKHAMKYLKSIVRCSIISVTKVNINLT